MNGISRDTFKGYDTDSKLNTMYDLLHDVNTCACTTEKKVSDLEKRFDRRKLIDTTVSGSAGFIGGFAAIFLKWVIGK